MVLLWARTNHKGVKSSVDHRERVGGEDNSRPSSSISGRSLATPTDAGKWGLQEKRKNTCWRWGHHPPFSLVHYVVVAAAVYRCHLSRRTRACVQRAWPGFLRSTVACTTVHEYVCSIRICATTCRKKNEVQSPLCKGAWQPHFFLQLCMYICSKYPIYSYIYCTSCLLQMDWTHMTYASPPAELWSTERGKQKPIYFKHHVFFWPT